MSFSSGHNSNKDGKHYNAVDYQRNLSVVQEDILHENEPGSFSIKNNFLTNKLAQKQKEKEKPP